MTKTCLSFCLFISTFAGAQNLVPNPGFEDFTTCPKDLGKKQPVFDKWVQPTAIPIDYFNRCSKNCGVPENVMGSQEPKSGDAYIGLMLYNESYRSYAQVELTEPLKAGVKYTVEFSVCLAEKSKYAIGNIGAYFTIQKLSSKSSGLIETYENIESNGTAKLLPGLCRPQIKNSSSNFMENSADWTTIISNFKARGGEKFLTLGNFFTTSGSPVVSLNGKKEYAYYFIDDVAVYPVGTLPEAFNRITILPDEPKYRNNPVNKLDKKEDVAMVETAAVAEAVKETPAVKTEPEVKVQKEESVASPAETIAAKAEVKPTILKYLFFEKNSAIILPESEDELMMLSEILLSSPDALIEIDGHTDETGTEEGNRKLSLDRAQAVANFMQMLVDIESSVFICKGMGSSKPIADNKTEEGRTKNRRVEFLILPK